MDLELRPPSPADGERLARMHYASWRDAYASFLPPEFWEDAAGLADRRLDALLPQQAPAELWVFEANDRARCLVR